MAKKSSGGEIGKENENISGGGIGGTPSDDRFGGGDGRGPLYCFLAMIVAFLCFAVILLCEKNLPGVFPRWKSGAAILMIAFLCVTSVSFKDRKELRRPLNIIFLSNIFIISREVIIDYVIIAYNSFIIFLAEADLSESMAVLSDNMAYATWRFVEWIRSIENPWQYVAVTAGILAVIFLVILIFKKRTSVSDLLRAAKEVLSTVCEKVIFYILEVFAGICGCFITIFRSIGMFVSAVFNIIIRIIVYCVEAVKKAFEKTAGAVIDHRKKISYFLIIALIEIIAGLIRIWAFPNIDHWREIAAYHIILFFPLLGLAAFFNEDISKIREHPYSAMAVGWAVLAGLCIAGAILKSGKILLTDSSFVVKNAFIIVVVLAILWMIFTTAISRKHRFRDVFFTIMLTFLAVAMCVCRRFIKAGDISTEKIVFCALAVLLVIYGISAAVMLTVRGKWGEVWSYLKEIPRYVFTSVVISAVFIYMTLIITIIRWLLGKSTDMYQVIYESVVYAAFLLLILSVVCGVVFIGVYIIYKAKNNGQINRDVIFLIFYSIITLIIFVVFILNMKYEFAKAVMSQIQMDESYKMMMYIILYSIVAFIISLVAALAITGSFSMDMVRYSRIFISNEALTRTLYKYMSDEKSRDKYFKKILPDTAPLMEYVTRVLKRKKKMKGITADDREIIRNVLNNVEDMRSRKKYSYKGIRFFLPNTMGSIMALYAAYFAFELRDTAKEWIGSVLGVFKRDGLVTGALKEILELIIG